VAEVLCIRPADDSTAVQVAAWGQAIRQKITRLSVQDLTAGEVSREGVETELAEHPRHLFWFGHGRVDALTANNMPIVDDENVSELGGGAVVAIACYSALNLGPEAVTHPGVVSYLGFDDEFGIPTSAPLPMARAIIEGLRCFYEGDHQIGCAVDQLDELLDQARLEYKDNGSAWGLSESDAMKAWLWAKSNRFSLRLFGSPSTTFN
jgi:hypothetical protein